MTPRATDNESPSPPGVMRRVAAVLTAALILLTGGGLLRIAREATRRAGSAAPAHEPGRGLPEPRAAKLVASHDDRGRILLRYVVAEETWSVRRFYRMEMLREGWKERPLPDADLGPDVLAFSRGRRLCIISLSAGRASMETSVTVMVQQIPGPDATGAPYRNHFEKEKEP